tara:strand:- start:194052 stop:194615 length:564 start_codon:yes stop_codon:yes gene_type:complete
MTAINYSAGCFVRAIKSGDLDAAAQQSNAQCSMTSGLAPVLAAEYPQIKEADEKYSAVFSPEKKMGTFSRCLMWVNQNRPVTFFNLYGQLDRSSKRTADDVIRDYAYLEQALDTMATDLLDNLNGRLHVGFPLIGCGRAGGDWAIVSRMIETAVCAKGIKVTVFVPDEKSQQKVRAIYPYVHFAQDE